MARWILIFYDDTPTLLGSVVVTANSEIEAIQYANDNSLYDVSATNVPVREVAAAFPATDDVPMTTEETVIALASGSLVVNDFLFPVAEFNDVIVRGTLIASLITGNTSEELAINGDAEAAFPTPVELFGNPSFDANANNWGSVNGTVARVTTPTVGGSGGALKCTAVGAGNNGASGHSSAGGYMPVTPGTQYRLECYVRADVTPRTFQATGVFVDDDFNGVGDVVPIGNQQDAAGSWTHLVGYMNAPFNATGVIVQFLWFSVTNGEIHYLDEVSLVQNSALNWIGDPAPFLDENNTQGGLSRDTGTKHSGAASIKATGGDVVTGPTVATWFECEARQAFSVTAWFKRGGGTDLSAAISATFYDGEFTFISSRVIGRISIGSSWVEHVQGVETPVEAAYCVLGWSVDRAMNPFVSETFFIDDLSVHRYSLMLGGLVDADALVSQTDVSAGSFQYVDQGGIRHPLCPLLGYLVWAQDDTYSTTETDTAPLDEDNVFITVTAPESGVVLVELTAQVEAVGTGDVVWIILQGDQGGPYTDNFNTQRYVSSSTLGTWMNVNCSVFLRGMIPGTEYNLFWGWASSVFGEEVRVYPQSQDPVQMMVWAIPS